jgi:hypothetical protein
MIFLKGQSHEFHTQVPGLNLGRMVLFDLGHTKEPSIKYAFVRIFSPLPVVAKNGSYMYGCMHISHNSQDPFHCVYMYILKYFMDSPKVH